MEALPSEYIAGNASFLPIFLDRKNLAKEPSLLGKIFPFCSPRVSECNLLGKGGYGAVYKIKGPDDDDQFYAFKIIEYASECSEREVRTLQELTGKGIFPDFVAAFKQTSFGKTTLGIFMELLEDPWQSLHKVLFGADNIYAKNAANASKNAANAYITPIQHQIIFSSTLGPTIVRLKNRLHAQGKVHHDIKPDNIRIQLGENKRVIDARFVDAGSTESVGEEYSERTCPGTIFYSLATAARGFEHGPWYARQKEAPDIQAQQIVFDLKMKGFHNKVIPQRNDFSITQLYQVINGIDMDPVVKKALQDSWPPSDRTSALIRLNTPKVTSIKHNTGPSRSELTQAVLVKKRNSMLSSRVSKKRGITGGKRTNRRRKTHRKKRST